MLKLAKIAAVGLAMFACTSFSGAQDGLVRQHSVDSSPCVAMLSSSDQRILNNFSNRLDASNRWALMTGLARAHQAHSDYYPGERMDRDNVLAKMTVKMSHEEVRMWRTMWARASEAERAAITNALRQCISQGDANIQMAHTMRTAPRTNKTKAKAKTSSKAKTHNKHRGG
jgi:hypothetical protein